MANRKLRISCGINLDAASPLNLREYMISGIDLNSSVGFDALDFNAALIRYAPDNYLEIMAEAKEYAASKNLRFELCHLPFGNKPWTVGAAWDNFSDSVMRSIDAAAVLGVDYAVMHPVSTTKLRRELDYGAALNLDVKCLAPFVEYGSKKGVNVVVENMRIAAEDEDLMSTPFILDRENATAEHLVRVADKLSIGICWDVGHAHCSGIKNSDALKTVGHDRLKMLHICDNFGYYDEHLAPFHGSIDWKDVAYGLSAVNYSGLFNFEVTAARLPESTREIYAKMLIVAGETVSGMMV